jgi:hypothetical protein
LRVIVNLRGCLGFGKLHAHVYFFGLKGLTGKVSSSK